MRFHKIIVRLSLAMAIMAFGVMPAMAAPSWCDGRILRMYTDNSDSVYIFASYNNSWSMLCNASVVWQGVSVNTCKFWQASALAAVMSNKPVTIYYGDVPSCAAAPGGAASVAPAIFMVNQ